MDEDNGVVADALLEFMDHAWAHLFQIEDLLHAEVIERYMLICTDDSERAQEHKVIMEAIYPRLEEYRAILLSEIAREQEGS